MGPGNLLHDLVTNEGGVVQVLLARFAIQPRAAWQGQELALQSLGQREGARVGRRDDFTAPQVPPTKIDVNQLPQKVVTPRDHCRELRVALPGARGAGAVEHTNNR